MSKNSVAEALRTLATSDKSRSETARLRDVFDEVEGALQAGVSRAAILETLHEQGFTMTAKSFESALYRLRRQRAAAGESGRVHAPVSGGQAAQGQRVHAPALPAQQVEKPAAAPQESTPGERDAAAGEDEELASLSPKERRERRASQFIKEDVSNPLLKKLKGNS